MKIAAAMLLTVLLAGTCIGLPVWLTIQESEHQAFKAESARALGYARDVILRADETGDQLRVAEKRFQPYAKSPCSPASLDLMREIDLTSSYLQSVGYVENNLMLCSSISGPVRILNLGPPDYISKSGAVLRKNVRFPFAPEHSFLVIQFGNIASILHSQLAVDTAKSEMDLSLAVVPLDYGEPISARGHVDVAWLQRLGNRNEVVFTHDEQIVAMVRSPRYRIVAVATVPPYYVRLRYEDLAWRLVPAGVLAGLVLGVALLYLARQQMALPQAIKSALRCKELFLEYQPLADLQTGRWVGAEALVRWRRRSGEVIMPDLFIPIAEQSGLIVQLTEEVIRIACRETGAYLRDHPEFHLGINMAPADFHSPGFLDHLRKALDKIGARPSSLILEITERGLLDPTLAGETLSSLRRQGFVLAIDDFGTGYSSLSYLDSLKVDYLKIDRSFIEAIGTEAAVSQVVGHIIGMAKDLGLRMIAEGVESRAQAEYLQQHGVQYGQGWLFGRPMPFAEVVRRMEEAARQDALADGDGPQAWRAPDHG